MDFNVAEEDEKKKNKEDSRRRRKSTIDLVVREKLEEEEEEEEEEKKSWLREREERRRGGTSKGRREAIVRISRLHPNPFETPRVESGTLARPIADWWEAEWEDGREPLAVFKPGYDASA
ncbi:hypothetical protein HZH68_011068 [Vespula germanica]|uniref:Uncharacterized protein n=1 Tax=Vespula germanica TaxID=30212 RepID=A0A834JP15_VESGE|nr:hypothetical protein HZH68_011068 [Vespula germanica]